MKILINWLKKVGKIISDGKTTHSCFFLEKRKEDDVGKNKASFPRLAFPLCLKTVVNKAAFRKRRHAKYISRMIPKSSMT